MSRALDKTQTMLRGADQPPGTGTRLEQRDFVAPLRKLIGHEQAGKTGAYYRHFVFGWI